MQSAQQLAVLGPREGSLQPLECFFKLMLFPSTFQLCSCFYLEKLSDCKKNIIIALKPDRAYFLSAKNKILRPKLRNFVALPGSAANL